MRHSKTAVLLAAGRGERLRPLTDRLPKPLVEINGLSLIDYHLYALKKAGFERILINHAYLGEKIKRHVGTGQRYGLDVRYLPEPPGALETGGALFQALDYIEEEVFLALNSDIFTNYPFSCIPPKDMRAIHLVLVSPESRSLKGDFGLIHHHEVTNNPRTLTYAGIAWYTKQALRTLMPGRYSITPFIRHLADEGLVTGEVFEGMWNDIGTLERLRETQIALRN